MADDNDKPTKSRITQMENDKICEVVGNTTRQIMCPHT